MDNNKEKYKLKERAQYTELTFEKACAVLFPTEFDVEYMSNMRSCSFWSKIIRVPTDLLEAGPGWKKYYYEDDNNDTRAEKKREDDLRHIQNAITLIKYEMNKQNNKSPLAELNEELGDLFNKRNKTI